eukprot:CAMPEP_0185302314 /NCGR_PEP_ID=MMETSP1363-20130426/13346_1 /TAXON_ID=38817 /ORGANISM="Gephyrocapsa oceanica, Strain RCC1303" /LENGTH=49 /DNA_ID=CAMNT_0027899389 /DNA_START=14 /DNA_END=163 /DNA_ORIENTATION=-
MMGIDASIAVRWMKNHRARLKRARARHGSARRLRPRWRPLRADAAATAH